MNRNRLTKKRKYLLDELIFLGPAIIVFAIVIVIPFIMSFAYSFTEWNGISSKINFIGFKNYADLFKDVQFKNSLWFTVKYVIASVVCCNVLAFALALILSKSSRTSTTYRSIFFVPYAMSGFILGFVWQFIFTKGFPIIGKATGIDIFNLPWLGTAGTGFAAMLIFAIWKYSGYLMIIYIAGFNGIPKDILEAADMDGATWWHKIRYVKLPLIMPSITVAVFLAINWSFNVFDVNKSLTGGGPFNSTLSVSLNIYTEAFTKNNYGFGTTMAIVFFIIIALVSIIQTKLTSKKEVEL